MSEMNSDVAAPAMRAPLPIFEESTSRLHRSNDGGLVVLPVQYGYGSPTFEVRHDGEPVLCTHQSALADAFVAGYDLAADVVAGVFSDAATFAPTVTAMIAEHLGEWRSRQNDVALADFAAGRLTIDFVDGLSVKTTGRPGELIVNGNRFYSAQWLAGTAGPVDLLQRRADEIAAADRADDMNVSQGNPRCPHCGRVMSWREHDEQGACNDCSGGAWDGGAA